MPEPTNHQSIVEPSDETRRVKQEWHPPALTVLGDAKTLTEAGGTQTPDGAASFIS
jgi:hypothetical protein